MQCLELLLPGINRNVGLMREQDEQHRPIVIAAKRIESYHFMVCLGLLTSMLQDVTTMILVRFMDHLSAFRFLPAFHAFSSGIDPTHCKTVQCPGTAAGSPSTMLLISLEIGGWMRRRFRSLALQSWIEIHMSACMHENCPNTSVGAVCAHSTA